MGGGDGWLTRRDFEEGTKMIPITIKRPTIDDVDLLHDFFKLVITDTFQKEGIKDQTGDLLAEIETKKRYLAIDLASNGEERYFLIAKLEDLIIGTIEFGPSSALICQCTNDQLKDVKEVGTIFIHPHYQQRGIGSLLLKEIYKEMDKRGVEAFCLDSGYVHAQLVWKKKFGTPDYIFKDYWDIGFTCFPLQMLPKVVTPIYFSASSVYKSLDCFISFSTLVVDSFFFIIFLTYMMDMKWNLKVF